MANERGGRYFREARFFLAGDKVVAQSHILDARGLLGYMRDIRALGGPPIQVQYVTLKDGTRIKATVMNGQYQAVIESPYAPVAEEKLKAGGAIICRPYHYIDAPNGWGATPYVIFDGVRGVVRQPDFSATYPYIVGMDATTPQYSTNQSSYLARQSPNYWHSADYTEVFSFFLSGVYHRGRFIANVAQNVVDIINTFNTHGDTVTTSSPNLNITVSSVARYLDTSKILVSVVWNIIFSDNTLVYGSAVLSYTYTAGGFPTGVRTEQATVSTSDTFRDRPTFNGNGTKLVAVVLTGGVELHTLTFAYVGPGFTVSRTVHVADVSSVIGETLSISYVLCWRSDVPCIVYSPMDPADPVRLLNGVTLDIVALTSGPSGPTVPTWSTVTAAHLWESRYVVNNVSWDGIGTAEYANNTYSYIDAEGHSFTLGSTSSVTDEFATAFGGLVLRGCSGVFLRGANVAFGQYNVLVATGKGLLYCDGQKVLSADDLLGVSAVGIPFLDCSSLRSGSNMFFVCMI